MFRYPCCEYSIRSFSKRCSIRLLTHWRSVLELLMKGEVTRCRMKIREKIDARSREVVTTHKFHVLVADRASIHIQDRGGNTYGFFNQAWPEAAFVPCIRRSLPLRSPPMRTQTARHQATTPPPYKLEGYLSLNIGCTFGAREPRRSRAR